MKKRIKNKKIQKPISLRTQLKVALVQNRKLGLAIDELRRDYEVRIANGYIECNSRINEIRVERDLWKDRYFVSTGLLEKQDDNAAIRRVEDLLKRLKQAGRR